MQYVESKRREDEALKLYQDADAETRCYIMLAVIAVSRCDQNTVDRLVAIRKMEAPEETGRELRVSEIQLPEAACCLDETERACWAEALVHAGLRRNRPQIAALMELLHARVTH